MANPVKKSDDLTGNYSNEFLEQRKDAEAGMFEYTRLTSEPPNWLSKSAKTAWKRIIPILEEDFPVSEADYSMLVAYALTFSRVQTCENDIRKNGHFITNEETGNRKPNPAVSMQSQAIRDLKSISNALGLTLEARQKLELQKAKQKDDDDPFKALMMDE